MYSLLFNTSMVYESILYSSDVIFICIDTQTLFTADHACRRPDRVGEQYVLCRNGRVSEQMLKFRDFLLKAQNRGITELYAEKTYK